MNKAEKSLRWVVNQIPDFKPTTNEEKMLVAIKLYSEAGAEEIKRLETENAALREKFEKAATFALDICSEDDCAGDSSVGLPPCPMWHDWDTDGNGVNIESGCYLKEYLAELKGEEKDV